MINRVTRGGPQYARDEYFCVWISKPRLWQIAALYLLEKTTHLNIIVDSRPVAYCRLWSVYTIQQTPAIHVYFEYICWKFAGRLLNRVNIILGLGLLSSILPATVKIKGMTTTRRETQTAFNIQGGPKNGYPVFFGITSVIQHRF